VCSTKKIGQLHIYEIAEEKSKILERSHLVSSSKPEVGVTHKVPEEHIWPVILSKSYANSLEKGDNEYLHKAMRVPRYIVHLILAL
jgi:hypothetical protein